MNKYILIGLVLVLAACAKFRAVNHDHDDGHIPVQVPVPVPGNCPAPQVKLVKCYQDGKLILSIYVTSILSAQAQASLHSCGHKHKVECKVVTQ
jgi:hypothetical protein